jgi:class 3 adenylate cyclase
MRPLLILALMLLGGLFLPAQSSVDSLLHLYQTTDDDSSRLEAGLLMLHKLERVAPTRAIEMREELGQLLDRRPVSDSTWRAWTFKYLNGLQFAYYNVGDHEAALSLLMEQLTLAQTLGDREQEATVLANIGVLYHDQEMYTEALAYHRKSLAIHQQVEDIYGLALGLGNIGSLYSNMYAADLMAVDSSIYYFRQSLELMKDPRMYDREGAMGWMMNNIGGWYEDKGQIDSAFAYYFRSLEIRQSIDHLVGMLIVNRDLALLFEQTGQTNQALQHINASIQLAEKHHIAYGIEASYLLRSQLLAKGKDFEGAWSDHQRYVQLRDSIVSEENAKRLIQQTMQYEYRQKHLADSLAFAAEKRLQQEEIQRQRVIRNGSLSGLVLLGVFAGILFVQRRRISRAKRQSDELLLNILPAETAAELKATGAAAAKEYEQVSVLFSDFKGFTRLSTQLTAAELVGEINTCFKAFDEIMVTYGLEKIKTIGDAYMAAGGLPDPLGASTRDVIHAGLAMQQFIAQRKFEREAAGLPYFEMRVGIHTGPVIAGVVGVKKFQYDVWGDTVNTASRMESSGTVGEVNISATTYARLKDEPGLSFEARGAIEVKGKGEMQMYFVRIAPDQTEAEDYLVKKLS